MSVTEAAACGTPSVVSRIAGHVDAVESEVSGLVVSLPAPARSATFAEAMRTVLVDPALRARLGQAALRRAGELSWEATAAGTLDALVDEAVARKRPGR